jgi:hypothetical protein
MTSEEFKRARAVADNLLKAAEAGVEGDANPVNTSQMLDRWLDLQRKLAEVAPSDRAVALPEAGTVLVKTIRQLLRGPNLGSTQIQGIAAAVEDFAATLGRWHPSAPPL